MKFNDLHHEVASGRFVEPNFQEYGSADWLVWRKSAGRIGSSTVGDA